MDSVDKYRHGVLIGNFVEDKFGRDLAEKVLTIFNVGPISWFPKITHYERPPRFKSLPLQATWSYFTKTTSHQFFLSNFKNHKWKRCNCDNNFSIEDLKDKHLIIFSIASRSPHTSPSCTMPPNNRKDLLSRVSFTMIPGTT